MKQYRLSVSDLRRIQTENGAFVARFRRFPALVAILFPMLAIAIVAFNVTGALLAGRHLAEHGTLRPLFGTIALMCWIPVYSCPAWRVLMTTGYAIAFEGGRLRFYGHSIPLNDLISLNVQIGAFGRSMISAVMNDGQRHSYNAGFLEGLKLYRGLTC